MKRPSFPTRTVMRIAMWLGSLHMAVLDVAMKMLAKESGRTFP